MAEQLVDLTDAEMVAVHRLVSHLNQKYATRSDHAHNLQSFRNEAIDLFGEIGLEVNVYTVKAGQPEIEIVGRDEEFDPEKAAWEAKRPVASEDFIEHMLDHVHEKEELEE